MEIIEALEMAIKEEAMAADRYRQMSKEAEDAETRLLFEQLAREEDTHHKRLKERLKALRLMVSS